MREENERRGLLQFVPPNFLPLNVLLIESEEYLLDLRELLPAAQIALLRIDELPNAEKIFDLIIAQDLLTIGEDFYLRLFGLNHLLSDSGVLLTQFFSGAKLVDLHFWDKAEIVKLLSDANYKEIHFLPGELSSSNIKIWLVKACKCTAEVAALKELFTPEIRAELSRILHRIEYDIDAEENFQQLMELCEREGIFDEYLIDFINQVVVHEAAKDFIKLSAKNYGRELLIGASVL